jgi:hypothetical protein
LKARARLQRWEEELKLVECEMAWTNLWFKHQEETWERRYETYSKPGLRAYSAKQKDIWRRFRENAEERFRNYITPS